MTAELNKHPSKNHQHTNSQIDLKTWCSLVSGIFTENDEKKLLGKKTFALMSNTYVWIDGHWETLNIYTANKIANVEGFRACDTWQNRQTSKSGTLRLVSYRRILRQPSLFFRIYINFPPIFHRQKGRRKWTGFDICIRWPSYNILDKDLFLILILIYNNFKTA